MDLEIDNRNNPILINSNDESFESLKQNQNQIQQYQTTNNDKILWIPEEVARNRLNQSLDPMMVK